MKLKSNSYRSYENHDYKTSVKLKELIKGYYKHEQNILGLMLIEFSNKTF